MPKTPTPRVPTFPPKDCTEPSPSIVNVSESGEPFPPAELTEPLGVVPPPEDENEEVLSKQIRCTETGVIVDGELPFQKWLTGFYFFQTLRSKTQWWRGDMLNHGEKHYGESFAQAVDIHGKSESRLATYMRVCTKFPMERRRPELSFDHHAECASLDPREADRVLLEAIKLRWSKMDVRAETARIQERNGIPSSRPGRRAGSTVAKVAASGKEPQVPEGEKPLIWNGYPLRVMLMPNSPRSRAILQGDEFLTTEESDRAAHHHKFAHGPALAAWLEEHNFIKGGDEPCAHPTVNSNKAKNPVADSEPSNSATSQPQSNGAAPNATESAPTPQLETTLELKPPETGSPRVICGQPITPFDSYGVGVVNEVGVMHRYHWECVRREAATVSPAAPPASPEPPRATETPQSVADEILEIMATYHEQEERGDIDTPGGLEHMGDVWSLLMKWETALRKEAPATNGAPPAAPATLRTPLQRAEESLLAFAAASESVNWEEIGANKLLRQKWLERLLLPCDVAIDRIQNTPIKGKN